VSEGHGVLNACEMAGKCTSFFLGDTSVGTSMQYTEISLLKQQTLMTSQMIDPNQNSHQASKIGTSLRILDYRSCSMSGRKAMSRVTPAEFVCWVAEK
jgi:hypothetical protein